MASREDNAKPIPPAGNQTPVKEDQELRAQAVSELFREHNRALVRFLHAKLQNRQEASELAQEAYVRLLELGRTGAVSFLRAYLFRIAANLAIDRLRSRASRERIDAALGEPDPQWASEPLVEKHIFAAEDMQVFWASLSELPPTHRRAFKLNRLEGMSTAEIARRLGKSDRMIRRYVVYTLVYCRYRVSGLSEREAKERMIDE